MIALLRAVRRLLSQPDFVAVFVALGAAAVGLNLVTEHLKLHYRKEPLKLRYALDGPSGISSRLGPWIQATRDVPIPSDTEHVLGTNQYVFRWYINTDEIGPEAAKRFEEMSPDERATELARIEQTQPDAVINLGITYYTGLVDTVAHIPDRCMLGNGFEVTEYQIEKDRLLGKYPDGRDRVLTYRLINFDDPTGRGRGTRNVAYLFHVNGRYESDPLGVRWSLQDLRERYGYYAKVELMTIDPDLPRALKTMEEFFRQVLPEFERCLPDWRQVHASGGK